MADMLASKVVYCRHYGKRGKNGDQERRMVKRGKKNDWKRQERKDYK